MTNPTITAAWIGAIGGLVVGALNLLWSWCNDQRSRKRIRTMLRIEIDGNLDAIKSVLSSAEDAGTFSEAPIGETQRRDALARSSFPGHSTWDQLRLLVPSALDEAEIQKVYTFYADLDELRKLHGEMKTGDRVRRMCAFETAAKRIVGSGNPIP